MNGTGVTRRREGIVTSADAGLDAAVARIVEGGLALVVDEGRRRGDLVALARSASPTGVNAMLAHGRGLVAVAMTADRRDRLELATMPGTSTPASIEASSGVTTGISAADRALTIRTAADPAAGPGALISPGHVIPLVAAAGGLLSHRGRVEAAVDLARLAGSPAAAICEVLDETGALAEPAAIAALGVRIGAPLTTLAAIAERRVELAIGDW